jgi:protein SCO1/2
MVEHARWLAGIALVGGMALAPACESWAHEGHVHAGPAAAATSDVPQGKPVKLADTALIDQDGHPVRLLSDVLRDKVVVVSFIYTNCTDACPMVSHTFSQLQDQLGPMLDAQVRLVSMTVDPARDTPAVLKAYSAQHGAKAGWRWLTGSAANVTEALKGFGVYNPRFENHSGVVLIGDPRSGTWTRVYENDDAQQMLAKAREYLAAHDRMAATAMKR